VSETWVDTEGAEAFLKSLRMRRAAQVEALVGAAQKSTDPAIRGSASALVALDSVIRDMEAERGNPDE
jgi:hypothetical protein